MWQYNKEIIENDLKSVHLLLEDKGITPIKKMILLKNLAAKHIPKRNIEEKSFLVEKLAKLCDTTIMLISQDEIDDILNWVSENEEIDENFTTIMNSTLIVK